MAEQRAVRLGHVPTVAFPLGIVGLGNVDRDHSRGVTGTVERLGVPAIRGIPEQSSTLILKCRLKPAPPISRQSQSAEGKWLDYRYFAAAPTRDQARAIFWNCLKAMVPKRLLGGRIRESDLIIDEIANTKPGIWEANIRPALADRNGWCWLIGVPEGRNAYWSMYNYAKSGVDPDWDAFTWVSADILPASEIESARRTLSAEMFEQEYEGSFLVFSGRAYHAFDSRTHCAPLRHLYNDRALLIICLDYNVQPGSASIAQKMHLPHQPGQQVQLEGTGIIGECHIPRHSTTQAICRRIAEDWGSHRGPVHIYGDATGGAQGSSRLAGSDWDIVQAENLFVDGACRSVLTGMLL
jgi:hypothetical protein